MRRKKSSKLKKRKRKKRKEEKEPQVVVVYRQRMFMKKALVAFALLAAAQSASGLIIKLDRKERCFTEQGRKGTAFSGSFNAVYSDTMEPVPSKLSNTVYGNTEQRLIFKITDPHGIELFKANDNLGTFYFMPEFDGPISICFADVPSSHSARPYSLSLEHHHGTTTEEYREIAKREELYVK